MAKKALSHIAIIVGAALIVIAVLLPTFLVPKLKSLPLDTKSTTVTDVREGALLDSGALAENKPVPSAKDDPECADEDNLPMHCFINTEVPLKSVRHVHMEDPADAKVVTFEVGTTILRMDRDEPKNLINASVDRITLDRATQWPVDEPTSTIAMSNPQEPGGDQLRPFTRPGIQYQFPLGAEKKSYNYYDVVGLLEQDIDFMGEEKQDGETVYRYEMQIEPVNLYEQFKAHQTADGRKLTEADKNYMASLRLKLPAAFWGEEGDDEIEMDRYYTNVRTVRVEPTTGMIVNGTEHIFQYYAKDDAEARAIAHGEGRKAEEANRNRTAMDFEAQWSEETKDNQLSMARDSKKQLKIASVYAPILLVIIGVVLILLGIRGHRRS